MSSKTASTRFAKSFFKERHKLDHLWRGTIRKESSRENHVFRLFASSLDQIGPFGKTIMDVAIALEAIAGVDESDATSMPVEVPDYQAAVRSGEGKLTGVRVGIPKEYFLDGMDSEVEKAIRQSISLLKEQGAEIVEISLPHTKHALPVYYVITPAEAASNLARYDGIRYGKRTENFTSLSELYARTRAEGFGTEVKRRILIGNYVLSAGYYDAYYRKAQQVRTLIINDFKAAFNNHCDVILTPASPTTAFKIGENASDPLKMYLADVFTVPVNLAGVPGLTVPTSCDKAGLPIGTQLIGPPFSEPMLLRVGRNLEQACGFDTRKMCA